MRFDAERQLSDRSPSGTASTSPSSSGTPTAPSLSGPSPFPGLGTYVARTLILLDDTQKLLGDQLELVASFRTGSVGHELLMGVELLPVQDAFTQDVGLPRSARLVEPVERPGSGGPPPAIPAFGQEGDSRGRVFAPYLVDRIAFSAAVAGLRGRAPRHPRLRGQAFEHEPRRHQAEPAPGPRLRTHQGPVAARVRGHVLRAALEPGGGAARAREGQAGRGGGEAAVPRGQGLPRRLLLRAASARTSRSPTPPAS